MKEWYKCEAVLQGQPLEELPSTIMNLKVKVVLDALQQFGEAVIAYDIISMPTSGGNISGDVALEEDGKLCEGPVLMWGNEEGRYILHNLLTIHCSISFVDTTPFIMPIKCWA